MDVNAIFLNRHEKLRSGWRFVVFFLLFVLAASAVGMIAVAVLDIIGLTLARGSAGSLVFNGTISLVCAVAAGWLCGKYLEGLPFRALGAWVTKGWLVHLLLGSLIGAATIAIAVLIAVVFGGLRFQLNTDSAIIGILMTMGISLIVFAAAAAFEEAFFRGYMLQTFTRAGIAWFGLLLTSLLFATAHNANPAATAFSWTNTFLAGIWFAAAYLKTRDLWFVFGLHLMWNWLQGPFFGIEVSGLTAIVSPSLFQEIDTGPAWLTGENYGIEGGIACTAALLVSTAAIVLLPIAKPSDEMLSLTNSENSIHLNLQMVDPNQDPN